MYVDKFGSNEKAGGNWIWSTFSEEIVSFIFIFFWLILLSDWNINTMFAFK